MGRVRMVCMGEPPPPRSCWSHVSTYYSQVLRISSIMLNLCAMHQCFVISVLTLVKHGGTEYNRARAVQHEAIMLLDPHHSPLQAHYPGVMTWRVLQGYGIKGLGLPCLSAFSALPLFVQGYSGLHHVLSGLQRLDLLLFYREESWRH